MTAFITLISRFACQLCRHMDQCAVSNLSLKDQLHWGPCFTILVGACFRSAAVLVRFNLLMLEQEFGSVSEKNLSGCWFLVVLLLLLFSYYIKGLTHFIHYVRKCRILHYNVYVVVFFRSDSLACVLVVICGHCSVGWARKSDQFHQLLRAGQGVRWV